MNFAPRPLRFRALAARRCAPVAQLDRASDYESEGRTFESFRARHFFHTNQFFGFAGLTAAECVSAPRSHLGHKNGLAFNAFRVVSKCQVRSAIRFPGHLNANTLSVTDVMSWTQMPITAA